MNDKNLNDAVYYWISFPKAFAGEIHKCFDFFVSIFTMKKSGERDTYHNDIHV